MHFLLKLNTTIGRPKPVIIAAIKEAMDVFTNYIDTESTSSFHENGLFHFNLKANILPLPISLVGITLAIRDFQIENSTYLKIEVRYAICTKNRLARIKSGLLLRPWIRTNARLFLMDFKKKVEKWG